MPRPLPASRPAPGNSAATFSAFAFCPEPYSIVVVLYLVLAAWPAVVALNLAAFSCSVPLPARPLTIVPL